MKKSTFILICVLCSFLGLNAQNVSLPWIQDFSSVATGDMQTLAGSNTTLATMPNDITDGTNVFAAGGAVRIGDNGNAGGLTLPVIDAGTSPMVQLSFRAVPIPGATNLPAKIAVSYGTRQDTIELAAATHDFPMGDADLNFYSIQLDNEATPTAMAITTVVETGFESSVFIDDIKIMELQTSVMYETFDGDEFPPLGWSTQHIAGAKYWGRKAAGVYSPTLGAGSAYISYDVNGHENLLITPKLLIGDNEALKFQVRTPYPYNGTTLNVKVSTTGNEVGDFSGTALLSLDKTKITQSWQEKSVDLSAYAGQSIYVGFHIEDAFGMEVWIDSVTGGLIVEKSCIMPEQIAITNITTNSADVSWTEMGSATAWVLEYSTDKDFASNVVAQNVSNSPAISLTGLEGNKTYYIRVKADCMAGDYSSWKKSKLRTACIDATIGYVEDFSDYDETTFFPYCWTRGAGYQSYPKVDDLKPELPLELYISGTSDPVTVISAPKYDGMLSETLLEIDVKKPVISPSSAGTLEIGVMSDPLDTSTFVSLKTIEVTNTDWNTHSVSLYHAPDTHQYLSLRMIKTSTTSYSTTTYYIDNVKIKQLPSCMPPENPVVSNILPNSFDIDWTPGTTETEWQVQYKKLDETDWTTVSPNPTQPSVSLQGLLSMARYDVKIQSICGGSLSEGTMTLRQMTACSQYSIISEDFEDYTVGTYVPECWAKISPEATSGVISGPSTYLNTTSKYYKFSASDSIFLVMPPSAEALSSKRLRFSLWRESTSSGIFQIGYMTDPTDKNTFVVVAEYNDDTFKTEMKKEVFFTDVVDDGTNRYIAFRYGTVGDVTTSTSFYYGIDDIIVDNVPTCIRPNDVLVSRITDSSAYLSFASTMEGHTNFQYAVGPDSLTSPVGLTIADITGNEFTMTNLMPNTKYKVWVRANCSMGTDESYSEWSFPYSFKTLCNTTIGIGFEETFNSVPEGAIPDCWTRHTTDRTFPSVKEPSTTGLTKYLRFINSKPQYLITPKTDAPLNTMMVSFKLGRSSYSAGVFEVGYMSDPSDLSTFVGVDTINPKPGYLIPTQVLFTNVPDNNGSNRYIAFKYGDVGDSIASQYSAYFFDNVELTTVPTCIAPENLRADSVSANSITMSFDPRGNETAWEYIITDSVSLSSLDYLTPVATNTTTTTISNLNPNTSYRIWVRAVCDANDKSDWISFRLKVRTLCEEIDMNWVETFDVSHKDDINEGIPYCWTKLAGLSDLYTDEYSPTVADTTSANSADNGVLKFFNNSAGWDSAAGVQIIASPRFSTPLSNTAIVFSMKNNDLSVPSVFEVGVISDLSDTSTFMSIETIADATENWKEYNIEVPAVSADYAYIAFRLTNAAYRNPNIYIDDVRLTPPPTCRKIKNLQADSTSITYNSALINWGKGNDETEWVFEYKAYGDSVWNSSTVTDSTKLLENLAEATIYTVRVKAICSPTDSSAWSYTDFKTECMTQTLPFIEDFSTVPLGLFPPSDCWGKYFKKASEVFAGSAMTNTTGGWKWKNTDYGVNSDRAVINMYGSSCKYWLITPSIQIDANSSPTLNFDLALTKYNVAEAPETIGSDDMFMVVISADDGASWTEANATVWSNDGNGDYVIADIPTSATNYSIDLSQYAGMTIKIGFYAESTVYNGDNDLHLDNIKVENVIIVPPTVETQPATDITDNSATLNKSVTPGSKPVGTEGFYYRPTTDTQWRHSGDGIITGLTPGTTYDYYAYATVESTTYTGDTLQFNTTGQASVPPTVVTKAATSIAQTSAMLHAIFQEDASEPITEKGFRYKKASEQNWVTSTDSLLNGLQSNTDYEYQAYAKTAINVSGYSGETMTFKTLAHTAPTVTTLDASNVKANEATLNKTVVAGTETILEQGWYYRIVGTPQWFKTIEATIVNLVASMKYEFYAFAKTESLGEIAGATLNFTTPSQSTGIDMADYSVQIYPNPAKEMVTIKVDGLSADADVVIIDMQGKTVGRYTISNTTDEISINVADMTDGNYIIKISSAGKNYTERLIVKK